MKVESQTAQFTGLRCPSCSQPVAIIENILYVRIVVMRCPACKNTWTAEAPAKASSR